LLRAKALLASKDVAVTASFAALKRRADKALTVAPRSVTHKTFMPASGNKHDYVSMGPYWWPNPQTSDGLPYVRRDGARNPEVAGNAFDSDRLVAMANDARDLALAHYFTGDKRYAAHAAAVVRIWFLDSATRMNPNLRFGQAIPGIVDGRGTGLIDSRHFWQVIDSAILAHAAGELKDGELAALRQWFREFATWMQESDVGQEEAAAYNNHGMFYDAQLVAFLRFAGDPARARRVAFNATTLRILGQIDRDGNLPHELHRTRPFHYTAFTLLAAVHLAENAVALDAGAKPLDEARCRHRKIECPLEYWLLNVDDRSLKKAVVKLAEVVVKPEAWKRSTKEESAPPIFRTVPVLLMAARHVDDPTITAAITTLREKGGAIADDPSWLMWPLAAQKPDAKDKGRASAKSQKSAD
jgi:hypothetical protein